MDRQQLSSNIRRLSDRNREQASCDKAAFAVLDAFGKAGEDNGQSSGKENSAIAQRSAAVTSEYNSERQPGRGILRKVHGPGLDALQNKFCTLQEDIMHFSALVPKRRESLIGRGGLPSGSQQPVQQATPSEAATSVPVSSLQTSTWQHSALEPRSGVSALRPAGEADPVQWGALGSQPQHHPSAHCQDTFTLPDDDGGLGPPTCIKGLVKMPVGNMASTKVVQAAQETYEDEAFKQLCIEGLNKRLQRTKDGATAKSRIHELAELVKLLRKCLKDMGLRTTSFIEMCAVVEKELLQQVENNNLANQTSLRQVEAELAAARSSLAATERDLRNERAKIGSELDSTLAKVFRLERDIERLTDERDRARDDTLRAEQQRQQFELELKELRRTAGQQQRDLSITQGEAVRALNEDKITLESKLQSLRAELSLKSSELDDAKECITTYEHEVLQLNVNLDILNDKYANRESSIAHSMERIAQLEAAEATVQQQLSMVTTNAERLKQELERSTTKCNTLEVSIADQAVKFEKLEACVSGLQQERNLLQDDRRRLEASLSTANSAKSSLTSELVQTKLELSAITMLKDALDQTVETLAREKSESIREQLSLQHQLEFAEARTAQVQQETANLRTQLASSHSDLEASRKLCEEQKDRLEQLDGEFSALKEVLGDTKVTEGESGKDIVTTFLSKIATLQRKAVEAEAVRRQLHNQLVDARGNIRVYCRVKPHPSPATRQGSDGTTITLGVDGREHSFTYDQVFGPNSSQEDVFCAVSELVQSALDGYHVCIFSYGQTGAGKTHTMQGGETQASRGIIPRALEKILASARELEEEAEWTFAMKASFIEVYNQGLRDLLSKSAEMPDNAIKHDAHGGHTVVQGAELVPISNLEGAMELVRKASEARKVVATAMNSASSRSHSVFMLNIEGWHSNPPTRLLGSLCLVDLAGSERLDRSQVEGTAKKEACAINSSLSALGDVFAALSSKSSHVPYRNSKLTYLLQHCLGGNGKTLMVVNINPEAASAGESLCSLRFAAKVNGCGAGGKGGSRRNIQTFGAGAGGSLDMNMEQGDPVGEARRRGTAMLVSRAAGPSSSHAAGIKSSQRPRVDGATAQSRAAIRRPQIRGIPEILALPVAASAGAAVNVAAPAGAAASRAMPPGSIKFHMGMDTGLASRPGSILPQRPGAASGAARAKGAGRPTSAVPGTSVGSKRMGSDIQSNTTKRSRP